MKHSFEKKTAVISSVTAILSVIIAAIGLIPSFLSANNSEKTDDVVFGPKTSARKMQSIIQEIADTFFDDVKVEVSNLHDGSKQIDTAIYVYNDESIDERDVITYAERIFLLSASSETQINSIRFTGISREGEMQLGSLSEPLIIPTFMLNITRTSDLDNNEIWVSFVLGAKHYDDSQILGNEYYESEVFKKIDFEQYDIEKTHYNESVLNMY